MKKHKENFFSTRFHLLNSQDHSEEIIWSSSESSDFEDCDNRPQLLNITVRKPNRKRKRKSKVSRNLDLTIGSNKNSTNHASPVLINKTNLKTMESIEDLTYLIGAKSDNDCKGAKSMSPVLCTGQVRTNLCMKSPVIAQKFASSLNSPKVRKVLFNKNIDISNKLLQHRTEANQRKMHENLENQIEISRPVHLYSLENKDNLDESDKELSSKRVNVDLIRKVKSFFESHFNSESSSQQSIADSLTPRTGTSDDVEILSAITQVNSCANSLKSLKHTNSTDNSEIEAEKSKKIKYKKDSLAYRLNVLLKKHNANISLWQHERFLAENSNFKIPKGEHLVIRIQNFIIKFGCFLLEARDVNDERFLILINKTYVNNIIFKEDAILKVYEPYQIFDYVNKKIIVNVCKFECIPLQMKHENTLI